MSKQHVMFLGLVISAKGGAPELVGPFLTRDAAVTAVQAQLASEKPGDAEGGVLPFEVVAPASEAAAAGDEGGDGGGDAGGGAGGDAPDKGGGGTEVQTFGAQQSE